MNRLDLQVQQTAKEVNFDPTAFENCFIAATDQLQRIVHELLVRRRKLDVTQQQLATALDMQQSRISEIERLSSGDISFMRLLLIAEALGVRLELRIADGDSAIFKEPKRIPRADHEIRAVGQGGSASSEHPEIGKKGGRNYAYVAAVTKDRKSAASPRSKPRGTAEVEKVVSKPKIVDNKSKKKKDATSPSEGVPSE